MKNIETILSELGVTLTDEQKTKLTPMVKENYKPVADWQNQVDKVTNLTEQLNTTKEGLKKFEGVDPEALNGKVKELEDALKNKDNEYQTQLADKEFKTLLQTSILSNKGKDADKIMRLLDIDTLKQSKNQETDIKAAIDSLAKDDMTKGFFDTVTVTGTTTPIGHVGKPVDNTTFLDSQYKGNPYYNPQ